MAAVRREISLIATVYGSTQWKSSREGKEYEAVSFQLECAGIQAKIPLSSRIVINSIEPLAFLCNEARPILSTRMQINAEEVHSLSLKMILFIHTSKPYEEGRTEIHSTGKVLIDIIHPQEPMRQGDTYRLEINTITAKAQLVRQSDRHVPVNPIRLTVFAHARIAIGDYFFSELSPISIYGIMGRSSFRAMLKTMFGSRINFYKEPHKISMAIERAIIREINKCDFATINTAFQALEDLSSHEPPLTSQALEYKRLQILGPTLGNIGGLLNIIEAGIYAQIEGPVTIPYFIRAIRSMAEKSVLFIKEEVNALADDAILNPADESLAFDSIDTHEKLEEALYKRDIFYFLQQTLTLLFDEQSELIKTVKRELEAMGHKTHIRADQKFIDEAIEYTILVLNENEVRNVAESIHNYKRAVESKKEGGHKIIGMRDTLSIVFEQLGGKNCFSEIIAMSLSSLVDCEITPAISGYLLSISASFASNIIDILTTMENKAFVSAIQNKAASEEKKES